MPENKISIIYVTTASVNEARKIADTLINKEIAACANIFPPITSIYKWQGEVKAEEEYSLIIKLAYSRVESAIAEIKKLHSYECPCIISWEINSGHKPFLEWVEKSSSLI